MPAIIQVASLKELTDKPDDERKRHEGIIPTLGGIGIFSAFLISFSIWGSASTLGSYPFFVASIFMLFLIGIKDDILVISPIKKLGVQVLASLEIVIGGEIIITNLGGLFGIGQISTTAGIVLTVVLFIILINSYNLIDGIDGLAGGVGIVVTSVLGAWFLISGFSTMAVLSFVLTGALFGFLIYNFHPAKIFMGDTGAMIIGFVVVYMLIQFVTLNQANPDSEFYINNAPVFALAVLIIPVVDTLRVIGLRIWAGKSPLVADYNHMHHECIKEGMNPGVASLFLWIWNLWIILLAYSIDYLEPNILAFIVLCAGFAIIPTTRFLHFWLRKYTPEGFGKLFPQSKKEKI